MPLTTKQTTNQQQTAMLFLVFLTTMAMLLFMTFSLRDRYYCHNVAVHCCCHCCCHCCSFLFSYHCSLWSSLLFAIGLLMQLLSLLSRLLFIVDTWFMLRWLIILFEKTDSNASTESRERRINVISHVETTTAAATTTSYYWNEQEFHQQQLIRTEELQITCLLFTSNRNLVFARKQYWFCENIAVLLLLSLSWPS